MNPDSDPGTFAFLFTDIEGSTGLWEREPERMRFALARHDELTQTAVELHHGTVVKMMGDGVHAAFQDPLNAVEATLQLQLAIRDPRTTGGVMLSVRSGVHMGVVERRNNDFFGSTVNRTARIMAAAHGSQILLSQAVSDSIHKRLPATVALRDLGRVRLRDLSTPEHIYQLVHPLLRQQFPALRSLASTPNNLPQRISSFVGRERELSEVKSLITQNRLVTLLGTGGIGKTRVALQVAADMLDFYPDGVWVVELGSISDPLLVPTSVAQVLGVQEQVGKSLTQTLCDHLKSRCLLLVLDTCEHVVITSGELAAALLSEAPNNRILVTSREPLNIDGEQRVPLPPLSLPDLSARSDSGTRAEAVQLFVERARLQQPGFVLRERQASVVAAICSRLDGIPLALELAAARISSLSLDEINLRLDDRFKLLAGGTRGTLPRQQTLRGTLDWSYELLTREEQVVLRRLAVFAGSFTVEAASFIAGDKATDELATIDLLSQLVARSLVVADVNDVGTRYRLLDTTRAYSLEKLDEADESGRILRRHAQYFRDRFRHASEDWLKLSDTNWNGVYLPERDNVRAALDWAFASQGDKRIGIVLAANSGPAWLVWSLHSEGLQRLETAVGPFDSETPEKSQARLWLWVGVLRRFTDPVQSIRALRRSVALYKKIGDSFGLGYSLMRLGDGLARMGRLKPAQQALDAAMPLLQRVGVPRALGPYFHVSGFVKKLAGDLPSARSYYERALSLYRAAGAERAALEMSGNLADTNWALGELDAALAGFRETIGLMRTSNRATKGSLGVNLTNLAGVLTERGELNEALTVAREGLRLRKETGYVWGALDHLALRAALVGKVADAARVAGYADSTFAAKKTLRQANEARARARLNLVLQEQLDADELMRLIAEGGKMTEDEACRLALAD